MKGIFAGIVAMLIILAVVAFTAHCQPSTAQAYNIEQADACFDVVPVAVVPCHSFESEAYDVQPMDFNRIQRESPPRLSQIGKTLPTPDSIRYASYTAKIQRQKSSFG